ncbi:MAG: hypothetical protein IRZ08_22335 [Frankia sp.]|nr:hypothetical protein [Frankia sp.]
MTVTSTGTGPLVISGVSVTGETWINSDGCSGRQLSPGAQCVVVVNVDPWTFPGEQWLVINHNGGGRSRVNFALGGPVVS